MPHAGRPFSRTCPNPHTRTAREGCPGSRRNLLNWLLLRADRQVSPNLARHVNVRHPSEVETVSQPAAVGKSLNPAPRRPVGARRTGLTDAPGRTA